MSETCPFFLLNLHEYSTKEEVLQQWRILKDAKNRAILACLERGDDGPDWNNSDWLKQCRDKYNAINATEPQEKPDSIHDTIHHFITMSAQASVQNCLDVHRHIENHRTAYEEQQGMKISEYATTVALYHMAEAINNAKVDMASMLDKLTAEIESQRQSRYKVAQQFAEVASLLEGERAARLEAEQRLVDQDSDSHVQDFISSHIVACSGNFLTTQEISAAYIAQHGDASTVSQNPFQKKLKRLIMQSFENMPGFSYARAKQSRGYSGLCMK
jgi:hypothetical protein